MGLGCAFTVNTTDMRKRVVVCIPTYKRPAELRRLLGALSQQELPPDCEVGIVVVDNEGAALTREICDEGRRALLVPLTYVAESGRGFSHVRNRAVEVARQFGEFLVFIDDDEVPMSHWLEHLVSCQEDYDADAVSGPVVPHFMSDVPEWIRVGRFFDRERYPTGTNLKESRTGNTILKLSVFERIGGFDETFTLTGSEDTDWFGRLHQSGGRIVWCNEAVVEEWVPPSRAQLKWVLLRAYGIGTTYSLLARHESCAKVLTRAVLRAGKGVCVVVASVAKGNRPEAVKGLQRILSAAGMMFGTLRWRH